MQFLEIAVFEVGAFNSLLTRKIRIQDCFFCGLFSGLEKNVAGLEGREGGGGWGGELAKGRHC